MAGPRGSALLDIFNIGPQLQAKAPLPEDLAYKFAYDPLADSYAPTGEIVKGSVRTEGGLLTGLKTFVTTFGSTLTGSPSSLVGSTLTELRTNTTQPLPIVGRVPMGFFDDIFGTDTGADNFNAGLTQSNDFNWNNLLNTGVNILGAAFGNSQGVPQPMQNLAMVPAVVRGGSMVVRGAASALSARLASIGLNKATAWTLLKQQGPTALLALGLTAVEVAHLARSKGGRRRMNMCNGRALRRASRRLEGFHKFYKRTCGLPVRRSKSRSCK